MSVYSLIVGMRSNALTKKFSSDLKQIMDDVEVMLSQQEVQDGKMKEQLRKHQLIRFYIQILYFTSKNESAFRKRLFESGLGVASVMSKIVHSNTE